MNGFVSRLKAWWLSTPPGKRLTMVGGLALAIVLIVTVAAYAGRPKFTLLFGGLTPADQAGVVTEIQAMGVPVQYDTSGTVEVPEGKAAEVRMRLATAGKLPKSAHPGIGDLSAIGPMNTPGVEAERLKAIAEGELAKSIEQVPGVASARVHITYGDNGPFADQKNESSASVNVVQSSMGAMTSDQARGIALLVSNAVKDLPLKNVVVLNERMEPIFNGDDIVGTQHVATKKLDLERQVEKDEERKMQSALDTMFGVGKTLVTVRCQVDLDEEKIHTESLKTKEGAELESAEEKVSSTDGKPPVAAGAEANNGQGAPAAQDGETKGSNYIQKVKKNQPSYTATTTDREKATGSTQRMVINVAANTASFEDAAAADAFVTSVRDFVNGEISTETDTTAYKAIVTPVKFDDSAKKAAETAEKEASSMASRQQIISLLPVAALLVVGFIVIKSLGKFAKPMLSPNGSALALAGGGAIPAGMTPEQYAAILASGNMAALNAATGHGGNAAGGQGAMALGEGGTGLVPSSPLEAAMAEHYGGLGRKIGEDGGIEFESDEERIRISKIKERTSIPLEQIKQMSMERPDAVAMLIKSWILDNQGARA